MTFVQMSLNVFPCTVTSEIRCCSSYILNKKLINKIDSIIKNNLN